MAANGLKPARTNSAPQVCQLHAAELVVKYLNSKCVCVTYTQTHRETHMNTPIHANMRAHMCFTKTLITHTYTHTQTHIHTHVRGEHDMRRGEARVKH